MLLLNLLSLMCWNSTARASYTVGNSDASFLLPLLKLYFKSTQELSSPSIRLLLQIPRTRPRTTGKVIPIGSIDYQPVSLPRRACRCVRHAAAAGTEEAEVGAAAEESPAEAAHSVEAFATAERHCVDV